VGTRGRNTATGLAPCPKKAIRGIRVGSTEGVSLGEVKMRKFEIDRRGLHERHLAGDPTAPADLALAYLDDLAEWLMRVSPEIHPNDYSTAAEDAILTLIKDSGPYDPGMQTLEAYLRMLPTSRTRACSPSGHVRGRAKDRS
jgi:hypothetical protein